MALSAQTPVPKPATLEDFLAISPSERFHEILEGELVRKVMPGARHGSAQRSLSGLLDPYDREGGSGRPGGWWLMSEVEILLPGRQPVRPDLVGWRIARMPELPEEFPVRLLPDWVCEVVSPSDPRRDTVIKFQDYARAGIPHYWLLDLAEKRFTAFRLTDGHYTLQAEGRPGDTLKVEPFEQVELPIGYLFGGRRSA